MDCQTFVRQSSGSLSGRIPETLLEEMEEEKMIQFIGGIIVGSMVGVAMMCLVQINRLYKHDKELEE
jgi:hypothetical protein